MVLASAAISSQVRTISERLAPLLRRSLLCRFAAGRTSQVSSAASTRCAASSNWAFDRGTNSKGRVQIEKGILHVGVAVPTGAGEAFEATSRLLQSMIARVAEDAIRLNAQRAQRNLPPYPLLHTAWTLRECHGVSDPIAHNFH